MGYPLRDLTPNLTHHVYSRCSELRDMLKSTRAKKIMLETINMVEKVYKFELNAFMIMDDHFHFVIRVVEGGATISQIMQYIKSQFARKYNKAMNRTGPFWNERFKNKIIENVKKPLHYFLNLINYLGYNPVRKKMIDDPRKYSYSSFNYYFEKKCKHLVTITWHPLLEMIGSTFEEIAAKLKIFEREYLKKHENHEWKKMYAIH